MLYFSKFSCSLRMRHINLELSFFRMYIFYLHLFQELDILQILYKTSNMYKFHPDSNLDILCLFKLHLNKILQRLYHNGNYLKIRKRRKRGWKSRVSKPVANSTTGLLHFQRRKFKLTTYTDGVRVSRYGSQSRSTFCLDWWILRELYTRNIFVARDLV